MSAAFALDPDGDLDLVPVGILPGLGCRRPIQLFDHATGHRVSVRCGARLQAFCASCAALVRGDRRAMIFEGLATAAGRVGWITLTARALA